MLTAAILATAGLGPERKVLDLDARMRRRECDARAGDGEGRPRLVEGLSGAQDLRSRGHEGNARAMSVRGAFAVFGFTILILYHVVPCRADDGWVCTYVPHF
jgi:hypothetical protein